MKRIKLSSRHPLAITTLVNYSPDYRQDLFIIVWPSEPGNTVGSISPYNHTAAYDKT
jgi:hypothetical protein